MVKIVELSSSRALVSAKAIPFLKSLKNGERLVVRIEERERQDATFELGNVEQVTAEIAAACKWK